MITFAKAVIVYTVLHAGALLNLNGGFIEMSLKKFQKRALITLLMVLMVFTVVFAAGQAEAKKADARTIGLVNAGPDDYYYRLFDVYELLAKEQGWRVIMLNSENSPEREIANVQDLIVRGVDAIGIITANAQSAGEAAKLANEANVPFFGMVGKPDEALTGGRVTGHVGFSYYLMGYMSGAWAAKNYPTAKIVSIDGFYGQGTAEAHFQGFNDALNDAGTGQRMVSVGSGGWQRTEAIPVAQDLLASGRDFDILYVMNEEMTAGVLQVFEEQGVYDKIIMTANGKEEGIDWIKKGLVTTTAPDPPTLTAHLSFQQMLRHFNGEPVGPRFLEVTADLITIDNADSAIPYVADNYMKGVAANSFEWRLEKYIEKMD